MEQKEIESLIQEAYKAVKYTYSPYSHFGVGAALLTNDGKIYHGANIENASYGATICAERTAVVKAVSSGHKNFKAIAIVTNDHKSIPYPCGMCRQVLSEFAPDILVIVATSETEYKAVKLSELLPYPFELKK